jgi:hypothetical protein
MAASIWSLLIPVYVLVGLLLLLGVFALLARIQNGRYLRPLMKQVARVPILRKWMTKASTAALEKQNPDLASAIKKMERFGAVRDPRRAQAALSNLSPSERRAYMNAVEDEGAMPEATNREMRRRLERAKRDAQRGR